MRSDQSIVQETERLLKEEQGLQPRELLLQEGFIKASRPEIQAGSHTLIPPTATLQKMLNGPYSELQSAQPSTRMKSLTLIAREIARQSPMDGVRWMRDPRASMPLIERLADADKKVAARALFVLMRLIWRYFPDQRAEPALQARLADPDQAPRLSAIGAMAWLRRENAVDRLAPLLIDGTGQDRLAVASSLHALLSEHWVSLHQFPLALSEPGRVRWRGWLTAATQDVSETVRSTAQGALACLERQGPMG